MDAIRYQNFADLLDNLLRQARLTQDDLASLTGLSPATISRLKNAHTTPQIGTLNRIAEVLTHRGVRMDGEELRTLFIEYQRPDDERTPAAWTRLISRVLAYPPDLQDLALVQVLALLQTIEDAYRQGQDSTLIE